MDFSSNLSETVLRSLKPYLCLITTHIRVCHKYKVRVKVKTLAHESFCLLANETENVGFQEHQIIIVLGFYITLILFLTLGWTKPETTHQTKGTTSGANGHVKG